MRLDVLLSTTNLDFEIKHEHFNETQTGISVI